MPDRWHARCGYCGGRLTKKNVTVDHIQPLSRGGQNSPENRIEVCEPCNKMKGFLTLDEWHVQMKRVLKHLYGEQV